MGTRDTLSDGNSAVYMHSPTKTTKVNINPESQRAQEFIKSGSKLIARQFMNLNLSNPIETGEKLATKMRTDARNKALKAKRASNTATSPAKASTAKK